MHLTIRLPVGRLSIALGLTGALLALCALRALPARADPDDPTGAVEVRLFQAVSIYARPDPASPIVTVLPPASVVDKVVAQVGADGAVWVLVKTPDGVLLGWMRLSDFLAGSNEDVVTTGASMPIPFFLPLP
jgi:hypothetical protein